MTELTRPPPRAPALLSDEVRFSGLTDAGRGSVILMLRAHYRTAPRRGLAYKDEGFAFAGSGISVTAEATVASGNLAVNDDLFGQIWPKRAWGRSLRLQLRAGAPAASVDLHQSRVALARAG